MKHLFWLLLLVSGLASAQSTPTGSKTRWANGTFIGTKLDAYFNAADSNAVYWRADSVLMAKYKGAAAQIILNRSAQAIGGEKTFTDSAYFNSIAKFDSTAKFFKRIIISPTGLSYAQETGVLEDGPAIFINRSISNSSTVNEHGIIDYTNFSRSGKAYNSFDAQANITGSNNLDHYSGFQQRTLVNIPGKVLNMYNSFHSASNIIGGAIDTLYHFRVSTPIGASATSTLKEYGIHIGTLRGVSRYAIHIDTDSSYFGNSIIVPNGFYLRGIKTNNARMNLIGIDVGTNTTSITAGDDFLVKNEAGNSLFYVNASTKAANTYGLLTATSASSSTHGLLVKGGSSVGSPSASSGQILIGNTSSYRGSIAYDDNTGKMYIDNLYNDNAGDIFIRTKTNGTPINALSILGSGVINTYSRLNVNGATDNANYALRVQGYSNFGTGLLSEGNITISIGTPTIYLRPTSGTTGIIYNTGSELRLLDSTGGALPFRYSLSTGNVIIGGSFTSPSIVAGATTTDGYFTASRGANTTYEAATVYRTSGTGKWIVGMRANSTDDYLFYNSTTGNNSIKITSSNDQITLPSLGTGTVYSNSGVLTNTNPSGDIPVTIAGTQTITGAKTFSTIVNGSAFKATGNIEAIGTVYASGSSGGRNIGLIYDNTADRGILSAQADAGGKDLQLGRVGYATNTYNIGKFYTDEYKIEPNGTSYLGNTVNATNTFAGVYYLQAGAGSANYGGGLLLYGHSHASKPGWVEAGISNGSGGKFSVNTQGLGTGTSVFNVDASGTTYVGSLGTGTVYSNSGTLTNTNPSDSTIKNTIKPLGYGLAEVLKLQPKTFYYNSDSAKTSLKYGFIAQEVKPIMPDLVRKISKGSDKLGLETDGIYVTLVKAIQEQQAIIDDLKKRIIALENK